MIGVAFVLIAVAMAFGSHAALHSYDRTQNPALDVGCSRSSDATSAVSGDVTVKRDVFVVSADVISVDLANQEARLRLLFTPARSYATDVPDVSGSLPPPNLGGNFLHNTLLSVPVTVALDGIVPDPQKSGDPYSYSFAAGEPMSPVDVTVVLDGKPGSYPWDSYEDHYFLSVGATTKQQGQFADTITGQSPSALPVCVVLSSEISGWRVSPTEQHLPNIVAFDVMIQRSGPVVSYALFVMALMWTLTLAGVALGVILVVRERHQITSADMAYFAALLFAYPLIRQTLPGDPGLGVELDYLSFFWAEALVATTLLAVLTAWIIHKAKHHSRPTQPEPPEGLDLQL